MHILKLALALTLLPIFCQAEGLSPTEREELIKRIEEIEKQSESYVNQKYRTAMKAYTEAMTNENSAMELYLKCEEMLNFEQKQKKHSEFRDWKKKNDAKFSETAFRKALQFQLQWLSLSLKANSENADREKLSLEVATYVDKMVEHAEVLEPYQSVLNQGVTSTVFAQAYNIGGIEIKKWPLSPGQIGAVYEEIILPPLRRADRIEALKAAWQKRMLQEGELIEKWSPEKAGGGLNAQSPAYEKFVTEALPNLRWNAEMDYFKAGDERGAALRMLKHIDTNMSHKSAPQWLEQLGKLVSATSSSTQKSPPETTTPAE
ncbi:MAG: hypothetical protein V4727_05360 [Verrucomicrobiota bacterium]